MSIDREFTLATLRDLIRIDSRNPGLEEGAPGEREAALYVARALEAQGWKAETRDHAPGRASILAIRRGSGGGPALMINTHLDTVGVAGMREPFSAAERDGRIYGRGAQDIKGGVAAALAAAAALTRNNVRLRGDLVLALVADEEHESIGTADALSQIHTDAAIVIEPSDLDVCVAHRGVAVFRLRTRGKTAHGGCSDEGVDANMHMGRVLGGLDRLNRRWRSDHDHPLLGPAAIHVPLVSGGRHLFVYSDACTAEVECRTVPGQSQDSVRGELQGVLDAVSRDVEHVDGTVETMIWRSPWEVEPDRPIVSTLCECVARVRGTPPRTIGHGWWEDSGLIGEAGIDAVVIGPRGGGLHTEEEWVDPASVLELASILYETILSFCGT
jgi:acetylornithine deacetylase